MPKRNQNKGKVSSRVKPLKDYRLENNGKSKSEKRSRRKNKFGVVLILLAIVLAIIIVALLIEFRIIKNPIKLLKL